MNLKKIRIIKLLESYNSLKINKKLGVHTRNSLGPLSHKLEFRSKLKILNLFGGSKSYIVN